MNKTVADFLQKEHIAVVSIVDIQGFPHSAALHFAARNTPFLLYFFTQKDSHKTQTLLHGEIVNASVVIGFSEKDWLTLQMEGSIHLALLPKEVEEAKNTYYTKFPLGQRGDDIIPLIFKPLFWKYTNYSKKPWEIITSDDLSR